MALTLSSITQPILSRMPHQITINTDDAEAATADWYLIELRITDLILDNPTRLRRTPNANGDVFFDVSDTLNHFLEYQLPEFAPDSVAVVKDEGILKKIAGAYRRYYSVDGEVTDQVAVEVDLYALKAGFGQRMYGYDFHADFVTPSSGKRFLAFTGRSQKVRKDTHSFLSVVLPTTANFDLVVVAKLLYSDGTNSTHNVISFQYAPTLKENDYEAYRFPAGYNQLSLFALATSGKEVEKYELQIEIDEVVASESFRYELTDKKAVRQFLFANSAGGWSSLVCYGEEETDFEGETEKYETEPDGFLLRQSAQYKTRKFGGREKMKVAAGYGTEKERMHFLEFLKSDAIYEVTGDAYLPIVLNKRELRLRNTLPNPISPVVEYDYAFDVDKYDNGLIW